MIKEYLRFIASNKVYDEAFKVLAISVFLSANYIMRTTLIAIAIIGMMTSCIESTTKMVIAHRVDGDTITTHKIKVDREFKVGEVVFPINGTNKFKIVRECRR